MKIVFFATPDFAIPSLDALLKSQHQVLAVVTNPDKEQGRGKKITFSPIKDFALKNNLPIFQPEKFKDPVFLQEMVNLKPDVFIVVAFKILPKEVYTIPKFGSFNLHGSILPKYRGAAPIQWSLINGDNKTGLTTFFLKDSVDTGNIITSVEIEILEEDNFGSLHDKMSILGAEVILHTLDLIESNNLELKEQDGNLATPAPKITKEICKINWDNSAKHIHNLIRGLSPYPAAFFEHNAKIYKVYSSEVREELKLNVGEISTTKKEIYIGCKNSALQVLEIQPEGRKKMSAEEFLRGYRF